MAGISSITIVGNLVEDPELRTRLGARREVSARRAKGVGVR